MTTLDATYEVGTLAHVDPAALLLERNIREVKVDTDLVDSIKASGEVLTPITAVLTDTGDLLVRHGHRRTLAAIEAGLTSVPVYVNGTDSTTDDAEVERIIRQRDENTRRAGLTAVEDANVVEQLAMFGMPASAIAKKARIPVDQVEAARRVAASTKAQQAVREHEGMSLDMVAAVAEFDDDDEVTTELLGLADEPGEFAHALQHARDERERKQAMAIVREQLEAAGVTVGEHPGWSSSSPEANLEDLRTPDGKGIQPASHAGCPGHYGYVTTGRWDPDTNRYTHQAAYACSDWRGNGHSHRYASGFAKKPAADMDDKEREAAKKARKLVIDNNKAWASATTVRRRFLADLAKLKTPPKGSGAFLARAIATNINAFTHYSGNAAALAVDLLGVTAKTGLAAAADKATEQRAMVIAVIQAVTAYETQLDNMAWRQDGRTSHAGHYLRFLESVGYTLSDVEKFAISSKTVA